MKKEQYINHFYPESKFGGFSDIDGTVAFFSRINCLLQPSFTVLDFGCGRGQHVGDKSSYRKDIRILKGKVDRVIGVDVDEKASQNPFVDEFMLLNGGQLNLESSSMDLIVCDNVLEHIDDVELFFAETSRVLKKGGYLCIRTPNLFNYAFIFSKLIPNRFHSKVVNIAQDNRKEEDVFPTLYKCNTIGKMQSFINRFFDQSVVYGYHGEPAYLSFSKASYWLGTVFHKYAPNFLGTAIFTYAQK